MMVLGRCVCVSGGGWLSQTPSQREVIPNLKSRAWLFLSQVQISKGSGWSLLKRYPTECKRLGLTWVHHARWNLGASDPFKGKTGLFWGPKGKKGDRAWPEHAI